MANPAYKNIFINITPKERPRKKKYCWFKRHNIKYIDYKDPAFLLKFVDEHGRIIPRRYTGTSLKYQRRLASSIKKARHLALLPFVSDSLK
ncbi:MAG: 30S ribosomal protein S18 [Bacteroidetes bacterium]|nr:30S ribosomal protein S18 [Bacteroidota bacterium]MBL6962290.1 30S ribosomal protein S18 [Bacteroidota bacterium]